MNGYRLGVFEGTLEQLGSPGEVVLLTPLEQPDATFQVTWR
ncbi:MAG: hypothetical protein AB1938_18805 [Myxococcota bacterium]